jgi:ElaB/YqjD/DUF883 family membrane-anchored ribosome-binding protein
MADTTYKPTTGDTARDMKDQARDFATDMSEGVSDATSRVKDQASEYGRKAVDQFNAATEYFRGHEMQEIAADAKAWVREHPTQALIGAAALGFLTAALLRRR